MSRLGSGGHSSGGSTAGSSRVFVALPLGTEATRQTESIQAELAAQTRLLGVRLRVTPSHQVHVTLDFLGKVGEAYLPSLFAAVERLAVEYTSFELHVSGLVVFPTVRRARVLGLGLEDPSGSLPRAVGALHSGLRAAGLCLEEREFRPHVTLARLREPASLQDLTTSRCAVPSEYSLGILAIYQSELGPSGAHYRMLRSHALRECP